MVSSMFKSFNGQDPYEGINAYMRISREIDRRIADYKKSHKVTRLTNKTIAKLIADIH